jgi:formylmethanofuran dehydrogenase subunit E-like metal-binding protein
MGEKQDMAMVFFNDNKSTIVMLNNLVSHSRTKHIKLKYQYIKEVVEDEEVMIKHVKTGDQLTDIFTKALLCDKFMYLRELLGITNKNIKREYLKLIFLYFSMFYIFMLDLISYDFFMFSY